MQTAFKEDVAVIDKAIEERVGPLKYKVWFKNSARLSVSEDALKITVPNQFIANWVKNHFLDDIHEALNTSSGGSRKVIFDVDASAIRSVKDGTLCSPEAGSDKKAKSGFSGKLRFKSHQKASLRLSFDTFIVGPSNEVAFNASKSVVSDHKSVYNPLFLYGGYGIGKTHLLQGICNELSVQRAEARWIYISAEEFTNQFVLALKSRKLDAFRNRFRNTDLLAIDDIHFLSNKPSMQNEFLHTFNSIDLAGKQIVMACDSHPKMINQLCDQLVNRFVSGMVVKIESPDFQTRCKICRAQASQMKKYLPEAVIDYIASHVHSNIRELQGALLKVFAYSSVSKKPVTLAMTKQLLAEHISRTDPVVHMNDIEAAIVSFFEVSIDTLHSAKKDRTVSLARSFGMYLARKYTKMSYPEIGNLMGGKHHATVILAVRKIEKALKENLQLKWIGSGGNRIDHAKNIHSKLVDVMSEAK